MDIRKRLTRRPLTAIFWLLLTAVMALLIGAGGALMYASGSLSEIMDDYHTSIAVRTDMAHWEGQSSFGATWESENKSFYQQDVEYFLNTPYVEDIYFHTVSAAYSPSFSPVAAASVYSEFSESYNQIMLVAEIKEIIAIRPGEYSTQFFGVLQVEEILSQCANYTRRTEEVGDELAFLVYLNTEKDAEYLQVGSRYMLCGIYDPARIGRHYGDGIELPQLPLLEPRFNATYRLGELKVAGDDPEFGSFTVAKRIDGSTEDFLADPDNANWVKQLELMNKQHQSVPVIGTEALHTLYAFVKYTANMTQGRLFTQEEYDTGAKVCILEETMANNSGINLGDNITLSQYLCHDPYTFGNTNRSTRYFSEDGRLNNPTIGFYIEQNYAPEETFTVVGMYKLRKQWTDGSYDFTPNTVFIPQKAQIEGAFGGMTPGDGSNTYVDENGNTVSSSTESPAGTYGIYFSMKLKNGMVADFETAMEGTPWAGQFLTVSQGSDAVQRTLAELSSSTRTLFLAVAVGWVIMAVLYVLLYQGLQRRNVGIMRSLGATAKQSRRYLWGSGMMVCGIGIAVGTVVTTLVMNLVQSKLLDSTFGIEANRYSVAGLSEDAVSTMITQSQLPLWVILAVGVAQILVLGGILYLQARKLSQTSPRKLLGK